MLVENLNNIRTKQAVDYTGRNRIIRNVFSSWLGYSVYLVAGFILPRLIDRNLGKDSLGIWDFCWSIVGYFGLTQLGISQSIDRYVAKFRIRKDPAGLNQSVSSVFLFQCFSSAVVFVLTIVLSIWLPKLFGDRLGTNVDDAKWIIIFLGYSVGITQLFNVFHGVITGCHRWDIHNALNAGSYGIIVVGMISSLLAGGGLRSLALAYLVITTIDLAARAVIAHRICPELKIRLREANFKMMRKQLYFGGKTFVPGMVEVFLKQTINLLIVGSLGAAALALFSRPVALVRHCGVIVSKFGNVLMPVASSLTAVNKEEELRLFFIKAVKSGSLICIPLMFGLAIFGEEILYVWMGRDYANSALITVLSIGSIASLIQAPIYSILIGLNRHGVAGVAKMAGSAACIGLAILNFKILETGLVGCALSVGLPATAVDGIFLPIYACRKLSIPLRQFIKESFMKPFILNLPLIVFLMVVKWGFQSLSWQGLATAAVGGSLISLTVYWIYALPRDLKQKLLRRLKSNSDRIQPAAHASD